MAITIQGIRLKTVTLNFDNQGIMTIGGDYELLSNTGVVLAKQGFNGYHDVKIPLRPETAAKVTGAIDGIKAELNKTLGME